MTPWFKEFRAEIIHDHKELLDCREKRRSRGDWSFDNAVARTRQFYRERIDGFARVSSIRPEERERLIVLIDTLATPEFPEA